MVSTLHPDAALIEQIGRDVVRGKFAGITPQRLNNWRIRGVPETFRPDFAKLARRHGVTLPRDFLKPREMRSNNDNDLTMRSPNARA